MSVSKKTVSGDLRQDLDHHNGQRFTPSSLVPDRLKAVHRHDGLLAWDRVIQIDSHRFSSRPKIDSGQGRRSSFSVDAFLLWVLYHHSVEGSVHADFSRKMNPVGATSEQLFVGVSAITITRRVMEGSSHERVTESTLRPTRICSGVFSPDWLHLRLSATTDERHKGKQNTLSDMPGKRTTVPMMTKQTPYPIGFPVLGAFPSCSNPRRRSS